VYLSALPRIRRHWTSEPLEDERHNMLPTSVELVPDASLPKTPRPRDRLELLDDRTHAERRARIRVEKPGHTQD
jgi:hypothetical protein